MITIETIKTDYMQGDLCMSELLASIPADGLTLETAYELYIEAKQWADGDN